MAIKRDELRNSTSCLNKAADDEPVFVLRANDELAPWVVEKWAEYRFYQRGTVDEKAMEARSLADKMREWKRVQRLREGAWAEGQGASDEVHALVVVRDCQVMVVTNQTTESGDRTVAGFTCKRGDEIAITTSGYGTAILVDGKEVVSAETLNRALINQDYYWTPPEDEDEAPARLTKPPVDPVKAGLVDDERPTIVCHPDGSVEGDASLLKQLGKLGESSYER